MDEKEKVRAHQSFVYLKRVTTAIRVPPVCAFCNQPATTDYGAVSDNTLKFLHCAEHEKTVGTREKLIFGDEPPRADGPRGYYPLILGAFAGVAAGIYVYSSDTSLLGSLDRGVAGLAAGLIAFAVAAALVLCLEHLIYHRPFSLTVGVGGVEEVTFSTTKAVTISKVYTGKYAGSYLFSFYSNKFADEFVRLNSELLLNKHDAAETQTVHRPTSDSPPREPDRDRRAPRGETHHGTAELNRLRDELNHLTKQPRACMRLIEDARSRRPREDEPSLYRIVIRQYEKEMNDAKTRLRNMTYNPHVDERLVKDAWHRRPDEDQLTIYKTVIREYEDDISHR
jgi:hypothetical protein